MRLEEAIPVIVNRITLAIIFVFMSFSFSFARCPVNALNVEIHFTKKIDGRHKVYAEIKDKLGINKVELKKKNENDYNGVVSFVTSGFTFIVEFNCSYFPKILKIYIDETLVKKIRLDKNELKYRVEKGKHMIYEVKIDI